MAPGSDHKLGGIFGRSSDGCLALIPGEPFAALTRAGAVNVFVAVAPVKGRKLWLDQNTLPPLMPEAPAHHLRPPNSHWLEYRKPWNSSGSEPPRPTVPHRST